MERQDRETGRQAGRQTEIEKKERDRQDRLADRQTDGSSTELISFVKTIRSPNVASHADYRTKRCCTAMIILNSL